MDKGFQTIAVWLTILICLCVVNNQVNGDMLVNLTFVEGAVAKGAGYFFNLVINGNDLLLIR